MGAIGPIMIGISCPDGQRGHLGLRTSCESSPLSELRDLTELEFDWCLTAEDVDQDLDLELIFVDL